MQNPPRLTKQQCSDEYLSSWMFVSMHITSALNCLEKLICKTIQYMWQVECKDCLLTHAVVNIDIGGPVAISHIYPLLWPPNRFPVVSSSSFFFFPSPILSRCRLDVYHTCGSAVFAGLTTCCEFRMPAGLKCAAARGSLKNTGHKNSQKNRHLSTIEQLCRAISSQLRHLSPIGKKLVKQQYFLHIFSQYGELGPLTANIGSRV